MPCITGYVPICIIFLSLYVAQILLGEEPIVEYRTSFMRRLELDAFFRHHRMVLEAQGAQHRLHNTKMSKNSDIVDRDRKEYRSDDQQIKNEPMKY